MYYVYIVQCSDGSYYTGITTDVAKRMKEHVYHLPGCAKYTRSHQVTSLQALWSCSTRSDASRLEYLIKSLPRSKKQQLISVPADLGNLFPDRLDSGHYFYVSTTLESLLNNE